MTRRSPSPKVEAPPAIPPSAAEAPAPPVAESTVPAAGGAPLSSPVTRDDVRVGDKVRGVGRLAAYGVMTVALLDEESFAAEAAGRGAAGVEVDLLEDGEPERGYIFLDRLQLVERAPESVQ